MRHHSPRSRRVRLHRPHSAHPLPIGHLTVFLASRLRAALRTAGWWAPSLVALLVIAIALSGAGTDAASGGSRVFAPARPWTGRASPPATFPPIARWQDIKDGTAYALHVSSSSTPSLAAVARGGNLFTFTTPSGDQIGGLVPVTKLADSSFAQTTSSDPTVPGGCAGGTLIASNQTSTANGASGTSITQPVEFALQAHFDSYLLLAYAQILYGPASDKIAVAAVCAADTTAPGVKALTMAAGCTATSCGSPLNTAMAAPPAYEQAMIQATKARDVGSWSAVWNLTSRTVTAQYSEADFAATMNHLSDTVGSITAIAPISGPPVVEWDTGGEAYFSYIENVTYTHGGKSKTVQITSYFLLQGGAWMFWFSLPYAAS